ncbi:MAG: family 20 glycosylhydrolase [Bacilli bacterium]|nr:family 20 glycosylhydrolase [Bacilli bacterium]
MLIPRPHEIKKSGSILKNKAIGKVENAFSPLLFRHYKDMILADDSSPTILEIKQDLSVENEEEYHLIIQEDRIQIISKTEKAAFYGLVTLKQLQSEQIIETQEIKDKPDLEVRGLMLDISRAKVLNVSSIKKIIDLVAELKYNHLELYVEGFSYEYKNIKEALADKNYLTQEEYLEVEKYAIEKYIDFVPNQNGFGHMSDWLALDKFKELAECPDGFEIWGSKRPPSTLDPTNPKSFELVKQMYEEMIPFTKSKYFNMNFDEPYELGHGKSKQECLKTSTEDVYIEYLEKLANVVRKYNKTPMIWGDVLVKHPDKISKLSKDIVFIDWGYNKAYDFVNHAKMLEELKVKYLLAPGTSTWSSITGRFIDMKETIENSTYASKKYHGLGILLTDWGDMGHLQYLPSSYLGFIYGAMLSWSSGTIEDAEKYLAIILNDETLAKVIVELSHYHELEGEYRDYGTRLFASIMWAEHGRRQDDKVNFFLNRMKSNIISYEAVQKLHDLFIQEKNKLQNAKECLEKDEIKNAILLLETLLDINERLHSYLDNCIVNFDKPIKNLEKYLENHKKLWLARNIKEGYAFSANRINWLIEMLMCLDRKEKI